MDYDALPCRADSRINGLISEAARRLARSGARSRFAFCDAASALAAGSPVGVPGQESFYEHVHLNFDGNYRLARAWAANVETLLPPAITSRATGPWASQERCERLLGLTDWNRLSVFQEIARRARASPLYGPTRSRASARGRPGSRPRSPAANRRRPYGPGPRGLCRGHRARAPGPLAGGKLRGIPRGHTRPRPSDCRAAEGPGPDSSFLFPPLCPGPAPQGAATPPRGP